MSLNTSLVLTYDQLQAFAQSLDYWTIISTVFGTNYNSTLATTLQQQWQAGDFSALPPIEILSSSILGIAKGAYAQSTNKIYLSDQFVATASETEIVAVLLEEISHVIDAKINSNDTPGDEGELFSLLVRGITPTATELNRIQNENDQAFITIDGMPVAVEMAVQTIDLGGTITSGSLVSGDFTIGGLRFQVLTSGVTVTQVSGALKFDEATAAGNFEVLITKAGGGQFIVKRATIDNISTGGDPLFGAQIAVANPNATTSVPQTVFTGSTNIDLDPFISNTVGSEIRITDIEVNNVANRTIFTIDNIQIDLTPPVADSTPPTVTNIDDGDADNTVIVGNTLTYTITFSEDINSASVSAADFNNAGTATIGIGTITETSAGVFTVQVTPSTTGTIILRIPTGSVISDVAGNNLVVPVQDGDTVTVNPVPDTTPPTITNIDDGDADNTVIVGNTLTYTITFSEDINSASVSAADFNNAGTATIGIGTITETSAGVFTVQVTPSTTGTIILRIPTGSVISDVAGNNLVVPVQDGDTVTVNPVPDTTPPTITNIDDGDADNIVIVGNTLTYTINFSEDINSASVSAADFNNAGTATIGIGTITETTPGVFTVQVTPSTTGTIILRIPTGSVISDVAGNNLVVPVQDGDTVTVNPVPDTTPPTITNIDDGDADNTVIVGNTLTYTITFSEDINSASVSAADFNNAGTATIGIGTITETTPGVFTVQVTPSTTGTIILRIPTGSVISDVAGNNLVVPVQDGDTVTVNPVPGITVNPTSGLVTTEAGGTATFTVVLTSPPTADVTIPISSNDLTEGTVLPTSLTFTPANFSTVQTVTVTGIDDAVVDGNIAYNIITGAATSSDANYSGFNAADVAVTNNDNDVVGVTVTPTSGLVTTEAGGTASFSIVLTSQPTADVTIPLSSSDITEGTVSPTSLTFTAANFSTVQTVTVTGIDDAVVDGNIAYNIITGAATSSDANYSGFNAADVAVTNNDNDVVGVTVTPTSGLVTTEAGGTASFSIVLTSQPTADVIIPISSSDPTEGTASPAPLTFTALNWNTPQTVTVTGVDDLIVDGNIAYNIQTGAATSADANYNGFNAADVSVTNNDNDIAGYTLSKNTASVNESSTTDTFTVVLTAQPLSNVVLSVTSNDTGEATVSPTPLTFTNANWNTPQTVTITGVDDPTVDGNQTSTVTVSVVDASSDNAFDPLADQTVTVTTVDNDIAGITVNPTSGLVTTEAGVQATFSIVLTSQPTADVIIPISSSDPTEGTASPAPLTFTSLNWNTPQTVTVTGVDDLLVDGNIAYNIQTGAATSADANYNGFNAADVSVTNNDNDIAGFTLSKNTASVNESGTTDTFTVVLTAQPLSNVVLSVTSNDTGEATVSPINLTFTNANWNTPQTVTITGVDELIVDGNQTSAVTVSVVDASSDNAFDPLADQTVTVTTVDNDIAGITVNPTSGLVTTEAGGTASFSIVLTSQPTADVIIPISSSDPTEGTASPAPLTFTAANWNTPQTVTVTGVDDAVVDGNIAYNILTGAATSADTNYNNFNAADVAVTNNDNDIAGFTITPINGLITTEAGGTANFSVKLTSQPTANVTLNLSSSDPTEGAISTTSLTFTPANFSTAQTVTVTGVDDLIVDGNIPYTIITAPAVSTDLNYSGLNPADVSVTNNDNDIAQVPTPGTTVIPSGGGSLGLGTNLANVISGAATNDTIYGYAGNDYIAGQNGADYIDGGIGNDSLLGEAGNDTILGGAGNDTLIGGLGVDNLIGGADIDTFVYNASNEGGDAIADFAITEKFLVSQGGFGGGLLPGVLLPSQFGLGAAATTAAQRFIYDSATGILRFDVDGSGIGASSIIATLTGSPTLLSSNISVF